jgi:uncharacterized protein (DUF1501 family)
MTTHDWTPDVWPEPEFEPDPEPELDIGTDPEAPGSAIFNRRRFLQVLVAGGAAAAGYGVIYSGDARSATAAFGTITGGGSKGPTVIQPGTQLGVVTGTSNAGQLLPGAVDSRVLVVVEMEGGNDGLSMVVPAGSGAYYDARPNIAIAEEEVLPLDGEIGLNPNLARLHQRGLAIVEGVGPIDGNLSHFEMVQRWDRGDVDGASDLKSGFLARLADTVNNGSPLVGLSVGGTTPRFANSTASTLALADLDALAYLSASDDAGPRLRVYHDGLRTFSGEELTMVGMVGSSWVQLLQLGATVNQQTQRENDESNPMFTDGGGLGRQLAIAADLIAANVGVRIVHARIGGFDTHENQVNRHNELMGEIDAAVDGFLTQIELDGAADRVLVATTSEFGRRVSENDAGTDHGSASTMLLAGPVAPGRYGLTSPVSSPDDNGNLRTEVPFDAYLATLAERWLGIEAASVLPGTPEVLDII